MSLLEDMHRGHVTRRRAWAARSVPDDGIDLKRKPKPKPIEAPVSDSIIDLELMRLIRRAQAIEDQLTEKAPPPKFAPVSHIKIIISLTAKFYGMGVNDILSPRREAPVLWARFIAIHLARKLTARSLPEIGRRFGGRDHTTIMNALRRVDARLRYDERLRDELQLLTMRFYERVQPPEQLHGQD